MLGGEFDLAGRGIASGACRDGHAVGQCDRLSLYLDIRWHAHQGSTTNRGADGAVVEVHIGYGTARASDSLNYWSYCQKRYNLKIWCMAPEQEALNLLQHYFHRK